MARLEYDFSDPEQAKRFPTHGWALNSQGVKILWCPLRHLVAWPDEVLGKKGILEKLPPGTCLDGLPFSETLRKLATTLRELHQFVRIACNHPANLDPERLTSDLRAHEMIPLYIDLAFIYLRRIADLLVVACRPLLFGDWQSVPREFKEWVAKVDTLESYKPICNFPILHDAIVKHSAWFNALRDTSPLTGKKGIRDTLEHRGVRLLVGKQQTEDERPRFVVVVDSRARDVEKHQDLLPFVPESIAGLCRLMTGIHSSIGVGSKYEWGDFLMTDGTDDDIVGYWPQIGG